MNLNSKGKISLFLAIFTLIFMGGGFSRAQTTDEQTALQNQLKQIEAQISQYQIDLKKIAGQKNTLQNKIASLKNEQVSNELQVEKLTLLINDIDAQSQEIADDIQKTEALIASRKKELGGLIRLLNERDGFSLAYVLASGNFISGALAEAQSYDETVQNIGKLANEAATAYGDLMNAQQNLEDRYSESANYLSLKIIAQKQVVDSLGTQSSLLKATKGKESVYQAQLKDSKTQAAAIKTRLYQLLQTSQQINFGEAVTIAKWASGQTGVRVPFLLAVITQESSLGRNVGTCNRQGDPPGKSWRVVMKPDRDQQPFLSITAALGRNPDTTPVSCPMHDASGNQVGWGGAMGPAQFIPSTWLGYENKISVITGKTADPWDIRDAFLAAAIKLAADGGTSEGGEWTAAMRYFSGTTNPAYSFYGDNVVAQTAKYESDINQL
jgi:hypothetical protein